MSNERCPVCWGDATKGGWLQLGADYSGQAWVCSQKCADLIYFNWETFGEFYHNFYNEMFGKGDFYGAADEYCSFIDWLISKPKCDNRRVGGYHHGKRHSEDTMKDSKALKTFIETLKNKKELGLPR